MRRKATSLALLAAVLCPLSTDAQVDNYKPYHFLLARECPSKHLEWISPADLGELIDNFHESLLASQKEKLDLANDEKTSCAKVMMGMTCGNVAALHAMTKVGLLTTFANKVCASHLICRGQSDCSYP
jgi:hypothetical protein